MTKCISILSYLVFGSLFSNPADPFLDAAVSEAQGNRVCQERAPQLGGRLSCPCEQCAVLFISNQGWKWGSWRLPFSLCPRAGSISLFPSGFVSWSLSEQVWANLNESERIWMSLWESERIWSKTEWIWVDLSAAKYIWTYLSEIKWIWTRLCEILWIWANLCETAWSWTNLCEIALICVSQSKSDWDWVDLGETEWIWIGMNGSEQIWMNLNESDWDWVSLYASDARHQARQAKPHPSHQSPIQLWLGLSVCTTHGF